MHQPWLWFAKQRLLEAFALVVFLMFLVSCSPPIRPGENRVHFLMLTNFSAKVASQSNNTEPAIWTSPELAAPFPFDELIVSWNAEVPQGSGMKIEARAFHGDCATPYYNLGLWAEDPAKFPRESVKGQKDADGEVQTDTLLLRQAASRFQLRVTVNSSNSPTTPRLKCLGISLLDSKAQLPERAPNRAAWGKSLVLPERSQLAYPGGDEWCSPTSVSMILGYWAGVLKRPELDIDVPMVARGVNDPNWPGTGNWPFNTAFAGRFQGLRAYVVRLRGITDLEKCILAGIPPAVSLSSDLLHGKSKDFGNGHLVVCVGFTETGDPIVHDPWARLGRGESVRRVYPRENLIRAWTRSRGAVYLIHPETIQPPFGRE